MYNYYIISKQNARVCSDVATWRRGVTMSHGESALLNFIFNKVYATR